MSQRKSGRRTPVEDVAPGLEAYRARMSDPAVLRVHSKTEWQQRRAVLREKTLQSLGLQPMPDRLPLEMHSGGVLERESYRAERLYWQTWPGVFAGGWLYTPAQSPGRGPAVLMSHRLNGHPGSPAVHRLLAALAYQGFVALAVDANCGSELSVGISPATEPVYNHLRALDLLGGHAAVDRQRIGLVAHSTGAELAIYLLALEDRIHAAALSLHGPSAGEGQAPPASSGPSSLRAPGILRFTNVSELCAVASPRALLFLTPDGDEARAFQARELRELRAYYHLWQQPDRLAHGSLTDPEIDSPEARSAVFTWFERELRGNRSAEPVPAPEIPLEARDVYQSLHQPPPGYHDWDAVLRWFEKRVVAQPPQLEGKPARRSYQERVSAELRDLLGLPETRCTLESSPATPTTQHPAPMAVSLRSEPDVRVPALWTPGSGTQPWPVLIAVHAEGKEAAIDTEMVRRFRAAGYGVLAPDVRLRGELAASWGDESRVWGRPEAGMAVTDLHACVQWLLGEEGVDARGLVLWGDGDQGVPALLAAGLDERITATVADCRSTTYRDGGEGLPVIPGILRVADVPQLASLVAPRPLWLYQVPEERVGFSSRRYYDWTRRSFQSLGEVEALKMSTRSLPEPEALLDWLKVRLRRARR